MSSLSEIQEAIAQLPSRERQALQAWLNSQSEPEMTVEEMRSLLRSLGEAMRDLDAGRGVSLDEVRKRVGSWAGK
jgi:ferric-dicitrate binding protein FerR (iron transport regulator)